MLVKWFLLYIRESKAFIRKVAALMFTPSSYAKTIVLGDERNFLRSVNFFLASCSVYIAAATLLQSIDSNNALFRDFSQDFIVFARLIFKFLVGCILNYLAISLLLWRAVSFHNLFHCGLHASAMGMFFSLLSVAFISICAPPVSEMATDIISSFEKPSMIAAQCLENKDKILCRVAGGAINFSVNYARFMVYLGFAAAGETKDVMSAVLTGMSAYFLLFMLGALLLGAWAIYAQVSLFSAVLNVSRIRTAVALIGIGLIVLAVAIAFPPVMAGLFGAGFSETMLDIFNP